MAVFLTSGNPLGFRALGSGGRSAATSYEQIVRTLRQSFGPEHAALFAEPNARASVVDWFANIEADAAPVRLVDVSPDAGQRGLARLEALVRDIEAKIVSLQKSDRQDERILGEMLAHGLEFPDESAVFLVGAQPVITFWGYVLDKGRPAVSPLRSLLLRRRLVENSDAASAQVGVSRTSETTQRHAQELPLLDKTGRGVTAGIGFAGGGKRWIVPAALWTVLLALVLTCGIELVRGCALGLPGWAPEACLSPGRPADELAAEQAKQDQLRTDYDALLRKASLDRQACRVKQNDRPAPISIPSHEGEPISEPPKPIVVGDGSVLRIPDTKTDGYDFLTGCWKARQDLTETKNGKETGKKLDFNYCFNRDGTGATTIRYREDGAKCSGPLRASLSDKVLRIVFDQAICEGGHGQFSSGVATCHRGEAGVAVCDEYSGRNTKPDFVNYPFIRTGDNP